ncbi:MAG: ribosomal protein S18-alanine N-acetyltransferase [Thermodesulfobacteriota bacterium]
MTNSNIEKMKQEHLNEVLEIERLSSPTPWSKEMFLQELENPLAYSFVYRLGEAQGRPVVGFICFRNVGDESELLNIGVHPLCRRRGIGKALMQFYMEWGQANQVRTFYLEVRASNPPAIQLYEEFSYQPAGTRKKFYQGKFDALMMVRRV